VELSSKVENVIFGKTCRREAIKAAQGLDLRLLSTVVCGVEIRTIKRGGVRWIWLSDILAKGKRK